METENQTGQEIQRIREALRSAQRYSVQEISEDFIIEGLADGRYQAWDFDSCIVVTSVVSYENFSNLRINHVAGELPDGLTADILKKLENFASAVGCKSVEIIGRRGWVRRLKDFGYNEQYVTVMKEINNE